MQLSLESVTISKKVFKHGFLQHNPITKFFPEGYENKLKEKKLLKTCIYITTNWLQFHCETKANFAEETRLVL